MKIILFLIISATLFSCSVIKTNSMNVIDVQVGPLPAIPSGDYTAEATITFKRNMVKDKEVLKNYKQASFSSNVEPIYFNLNQKTQAGRKNAQRAKKGKLRAAFKIAADPTYDLAMYNLSENYPLVDYWTNIRVEREIQGRKSVIIATGNALRFSWLTLESLLTGNADYILNYQKRDAYIKSGPETVRLVATGVDIMTDEEYEAYKKTPNYDKVKTIINPSH
jgi:hypothetical protein